MSSPDTNKHCLSMIEDLMDNFYRMIHWDRDFVDNMDVQGERFTPYQVMRLEKIHLYCIPEVTK